MEIHTRLQSQLRSFLTLVEHALHFCANDLASQAGNLHTDADVMGLYDKMLESCWAKTLTPHIGIGVNDADGKIHSLHLMLHVENIPFLLLSVDGDGLQVANPGGLFCLSTATEVTGAIHVPGFVQCYMQPPFRNNLHVLETVLRHIPLAHYPEMSVQRDGMLDLLTHAADMPISMADVMRIVPLDMATATQVQAVAHLLDVLYPPSGDAPLLADIWQRRTDSIGMDNLSVYDAIATLKTTSVPPTVYAILNRGGNRLALLNVVIDLENENCVQLEISPEQKAPRLAIHFGDVQPGHPEGGTLLMDLYTEFLDNVQPETHDAHVTFLRRILQAYTAITKNDEAAERQRQTLLNMLQPHSTCTLV